MYNYAGNSVEYRTGVRLVSQRLDFARPARDLLVRSACASVLGLKYRFVFWLLLWVHTTLIYDRIKKKTLF